jgi:hypothetical protein
LINGHSGTSKKGKDKLETEKGEESRSRENERDFNQDFFYSAISRPSGGPNNRAKATGKCRK